MADPRFLPSPPQIRINAKLILTGLVVLVLLIGLFSSFYTVPMNSVAVVQRFGAYLDTTKPGLHFKLPWGVDTITILEVDRQQKLEFGFATVGATNPYQYSEGAHEQEAEKTMVTGDLNTALVEWVVQYTIEEPKAYLFTFRDPLQTLRDLSQSVMREVVGDRSVDEVLTVGRQEMEIKAAERLRFLVKTLNIGIRIDQIQLGNVNPPRSVEMSFSDVNKAQQEKESTINQAKAEYFRAVPRARGEAKQKMSAAEGYATKRLNEAEGDASRFTALLTEFKKAPEVTKKRIYLETMSEILPGVSGKVILDDKAPQFLPMMNLKQAK
ncbi:MAG: FtsH protease activity modulator HflK [Verrucomicrobiaceae bacterium]|nr:FtsH protease activity modulator HflK [Verrucomicrobiaceae bacterium]